MTDAELLNVITDTAAIVSECGAGEELEFLRRLLDVAEERRLEVTVDLN